MDARGLCRIGRALRFQAFAEGSAVGKGVGEPTEELQLTVDSPLRLVECGDDFVGLPVCGVEGSVDSRIDVVHAGRTLRKGRICRLDRIVERVSETAQAVGALRAGAGDVADRCTRSVERARACGDQAL